MTFENLTKDTQCNCLIDASEDTTATFARVLNKDAATEKDFFSKWDKEHRGEECENICGLKGVSVSKLESDIVKQEVIGLYNQIFKISPKYKKGVLIFKFKNEAGMSKSTPDNTNRYHHDFYKCDNFSLNSIEQQEVCFLTPNPIV
jgi:hypothetical protein